MLKFAGEIVGIAASLLVMVLLGDRLQRAIENYIDRWPEHVAPDLKAEALCPELAAAHRHLDAARGIVRD
jgi:hypothetical protein